MPRVRALVLGAVLLSVALPGCGGGGATPEGICRADLNAISNDFGSARLDHSKISTDVDRTVQDMKAIHDSGDHVFDTVARDLRVGWQLYPLGPQPFDGAMNEFVTVCGQFQNGGGGVYQDPNQ